MAVHGGWASLAVGYGAWDLDITWKEWWHLVGVAFMGNGGLRAIQYFSNNPLPPDETGTTDVNGKPIVPTAIISINPLAKVTTLSEPKP